MAESDWVAQIEQDVNEWYTNYGPFLSGIFFDEAQNTCGPTSGSNAWADEYAALTQYVKQNHPGAITVDNPGAPVPQCYEDSADILLTFEGTGTATKTTTRGSIGQRQTRRRSGTSSTTCPARRTRWREADLLAKARGAGYVFITDAGLPNPSRRCSPEAS